MPSRVRRAEIALDLACVRCYLGFTRLTRAARRHRAGGDGGVDIVIRPFQAEPGAPSAGEPLFEVWRRTRGEAFVRQVASDTSFGVADGLDLRFSRALFTTPSGRTGWSPARPGKGSASGWRSGCSGRTSPTGC